MARTKASRKTSTKTKSRAPSKGKAASKPKTKKQQKVEENLPAPRGYVKGKSDKWSLNNAENCEAFLDFIREANPNEEVINPFTNRKARVDGAAMKTLLKKCKSLVPNVELPSWFTQRGKPLAVKGLSMATAMAAATGLLREYNISLGDLNINGDFGRNADRSEVERIISYDGSKHNKNRNLEILLLMAERQSGYGSVTYSELAGFDTDVKIGTTQGRELAGEISRLSDGQFWARRGQFINDMFFSKTVTHPIPGSDSGITKTFKKYGNPTIVNIAHAFNINYTAICAASLGLLDIVSDVSGNVLSESKKFYRNLIGDAAIVNADQYIPISISAALSSLIENGYTGLGSSKTRDIRRANSDDLQLSYDASGKPRFEGTGKNRIRVPTSEEDDLGTKYFKNLRSKLVTRLFDPINNVNCSTFDRNFLNILNFLEERAYDVRGIQRESMDVVSFHSKASESSCPGPKSSPPKRSSPKKKAPSRKGKGSPGRKKNSPSKRKGKGGRRYSDTSMDEE